MSLLFSIALLLFTETAQAVHTATVNLAAFEASDNTLSNSTAETSLYSFSVPGGTLGTSRVLRFRIIGVYSVDATPPTITYRVKYGSCTVSSGALTDTGARTNQPLNLYGYVSARGGTGAQIVWFQVETSSSGPDIMAYTAACSTDSTTAQTLDVTWQWGTAEASATVTRQIGMVEQLGR